MQWLIVNMLSSICNVYASMVGMHSIAHTCPCIYVHARGAGVGWVSLLTPTLLNVNVCTFPNILIFFIITYRAKAAMRQNSYSIFQ